MITNSDTQPPAPWAATTLHISHWKAGSTWIRRILRQLEPERFARPPIESWGDPFPSAVPQGAIYSCYATREQVAEAGLLQAPRFVVVRDLRDTLVSAYFSFRDTHTTSKIVAPLRRRLRNRRFDAGMIYLMDEFLPRVVAIQRSWADEAVIHYEDLLVDDLAILRRTFARLGLEIEDERLERSVRANRFRSQTGRHRGEEAPEHLRKGIAGDWRNHFSDRITAEFEARFGDLIPR